MSIFTVTTQRYPLKVATTCPYRFEGPPPQEEVQLMTPTEWDEFADTIPISPWEELSTTLPPM